MKARTHNEALEKIAEAKTRHQIHPRQMQNLTAEVEVSYGRGIDDKYMIDGWIQHDFHRLCHDVSVCFDFDLTSEKRAEITAAKIDVALSKLNEDRIIITKEIIDAMLEKPDHAENIALGIHYLVIYKNPNQAIDKRDISAVVSSPEHADSLGCGLALINSDGIQVTDGMRRLMVANAKHAVSIVGRFNDYLDVEVSTEKFIVTGIIMSNVINASINHPNNIYTPALYLNPRTNNANFKMAIDFLTRNNITLTYNALQLLTTHSGQANQLAKELVEHAKQERLMVMLSKSANEAREAYEARVAKRNNNKH